MASLPVKLPNGVHSKLSASGSERWLNCPGCIQASEGIESFSSQDAALGTLMHHVAAVSLEKGTSPDLFLGKSFLVDRHSFLIDAKMLEGVKEYVVLVNRESRREGPTACFSEDGAHTIKTADGKNYLLEIEKSLTPALQKLDPDFGGTADCLLLDLDSGLLRVYDYKNGSGIWVDVKDNGQLKYYALGALLRFEGMWPVKEVEIVIVQPNFKEGESVRRYSFPASELLEYEVDLIEGAARTREPFPRLEPGPWCLWCPAAAKPCPALEKAEAELLDEEFADLPSADNTTGDLVHAISPEKIGQAFPVMDALEARIKQVRQLAYDYHMRGIAVPGTKLVAKRATRKWRDEDLAKDFFGMRDDAWEPVKLKTVNQMEKAVGKAHFAKVAEAEDLVVKESSGYKVVLATAPGKPAAPALVTADDFEDLD